VNPDLTLRVEGNITTIYEIERTWIGALCEERCLPCWITVMNDSACQEHDIYIHRWCGWGEAVLPLQSNLWPRYRGPLFILASSAPGHMMLLPPIHIPQAPLPLCSHHPYSDPSRLVSHGDARLLAGRPAPQGSAPGSKRSVTMNEREIQSWEPISTTQRTANGLWHQFGNNTNLAQLTCFVSWHSSKSRFPATHFPPTPSSKQSLKEQSISHPTHLSGPRVAQGCAKDKGLQSSWHFLPSQRGV